MFRSVTDMRTHEAVPTRTDGKATTGTRRAKAISLACDAGLSPATFYAGQAAGLSVTASLLAATGVAGAWLLWTAYRKRRIDALAGLMLATYALMLVIALLARDERMLLLRDPATSALAGLVFLASCATPTPALAYLGRRLHGRPLPDDPGMRRSVRMQTAVWGGGLVAEAAVRAAMLFLLPVTVTAGLSTVIELSVIGALLVWSAWCRRRARLALA
ncbi:membrane protein [Streptantibioticus cattleyicolor NRRL 8057 = DSM 46488]|uniref:Membrane protein n=2 Tax=Kitasatosporales TaxID=85011 RepID=G8X445_STREN|nr:membrane protein [Streptantibioticus cattleyicolor NRRL 8057 = DSM 46488]